MAQKKYDIVAKVGTFTSRKGEEKSRYLNVGSVIQGEHGPYIMMNKTFNPAGVPDSRGGDSILLSLFEHKPRDGQQKTPPPPQTAAEVDYNDDIPF